jgi:hypothetical protein
MPPNFLIRKPLPLAGAFLFSGFVKKRKITLFWEFWTNSETEVQRRHWHTRPI